MLKAQHAIGLAVFAACLAGCSDQKPAGTTKAKRLAAAEAAVSSPPGSRSYELTDGRLTVLDVPVKSPHGLLSRQNCFVWRDGQSGAASISCPQSGELVYE